MLHIIYWKSSLVDFLFADYFSKEGYNLIAIPNIKLGFWSRVIFYIERKFNLNIIPTRRFSSDTLKQLKDIKKDDKVLLFDIDRLVDIKFIKTYIDCRNISLWLWNKLENTNNYKYISCIKKDRIEIYTFDPFDSKNYNITLLNQIYKPVLIEEGENLNVIYDFLFIGRDKGRSVYLNELAENLKSLGYSIKIIIFEKNPQKYYYSNISYIKDELSYNDILSLISKSRCIIDLVKKGQEGITLRVLESVFLQKKIITDNPNVENTDLYNSNNIFLLKNRNIAEVVEFLGNEFIPIEDVVLNRYSIYNWMKVFK